MHTLAPKGRLPFLLIALFALTLLQPKAPRLVASLPHGASDASFSRDGKQLVTSDGASAIAWDASGQKVAELVTGERELRVRHSSAGHVATVGLGGAVLFDKNLKRVGGLGAPAGWPRDAVFSADGKLVALGFEDEHPPERHDGGVVLFDAATGQERSRVLSGPVQRVEFRKDGKRLLAESTDRTGTFCQLYDAAGGFVKSWYASGLTWSPDGKRFALQRGKKLEVYTGDETLVWSEVVEGSLEVSFSADSKWLLARPAGRERFVLVFEAAKGKLAGRVTYADVVVRAGLHPKKPWVVAGTATGAVSVRDVKTGKPVVEGLKAGSEVTCLAFDASGKRLAVGEKAGVCSLWELP